MEVDKLQSLDLLNSYKYCIYPFSDRNQKYFDFYLKMQYIGIRGETYDKKHWPILFTILMVIINIVCAIAASNSTDTGYAILAGLVIFMVLLPLSGVVMGVWYGWRSRSPLKWLLAPAAFLGVCVFLLATDLISGSESMQLDIYASISSFTGVACLAAEAIAGAISWLVMKNEFV